LTFRKKRNKSFFDKSSESDWIYPKTRNVYFFGLSSDFDLTFPFFLILSIAQGAFVFIKLLTLFLHKRTGY